MYARLAFFDRDRDHPRRADHRRGTRRWRRLFRVEMRRAHATSDQGGRCHCAVRQPCMSSVQRLCERAIWLQRGCVKMAGRTVDLAKACITTRFWSGTRLGCAARQVGAVLRLRQREGAARNDRETEKFSISELVAADGQQPPGSQAVARTDETGSISARSIAASVHRHARKVSAERRFHYPRLEQQVDTGSASQCFPCRCCARPDLPSGPNDKWETAEARS